MRSISLGAFLLAVIVVLLNAANAAAQTPSIDAAKAHQYFAEAKALSDRDNGALWKVQLCGPLLFVDPETRYAVANQADAEGKLKPFDGVFAGTTPQELGVANTATKWAGLACSEPDTSAWRLLCNNKRVSNGADAQSERNQSQQTAASGGDHEPTIKI